MKVRELIALPAKLQPEAEVIVPNGAAASGRLFYARGPKMKNLLRRLIWWAIRDEVETRIDMSVRLAHNDVLDRVPAIVRDHEMRHG